MKKILILLFCFVATVSSAQLINNINNKVNNIDNGINNVGGTINGAENAVDRAKNLIKGIIPPSQNNQPAPAPSASSPAQPSGQSIRQGNQNPAVAEPGLNTTTIIYSKCDFSRLRDMLSLLATCPDIKSTDKTFANNTALITIRHTRSTDAILDFISAVAGSKYEISAFDKGSITLSLSSKVQGQN